MDKLYSRATARRLINDYDLDISKNLGQNFLTDKNIVDKIVHGSHIGKEDLVIEVGPGMGVLTAAAAEQARMVIGVEIDERLIPVLHDTLKEYDNIRIIKGDFLKTDIFELINQAKKDDKRGFSGVRLIGNLPYYITTPIIMKVLEEPGETSQKIQSLTVMMQKEVAGRIRANPGTKDYGALSVAIRYYCTTEMVAVVSKEVFIPKPKVDSAVLHLSVRDVPPVVLSDPAIFFTVVRSGFGQRRKTLLNSLTGINGLNKQQIQALLDSAGIDPVRRAETLDLSEFAAISNLVSKEWKA
ncbi:MAG TPA: 16S rRNA (adenine(1518)-N(6)/adenine(1519)-N(6))-dimethyltransferase RsmA [Bacillota bacterium]|jgi:16S rRNA (adenine1518-N6/adenine1519-N6)-dimethyltransferase|nr:16S rRNA (adenine(1518)-N(6)/adenine(1519)-N(6))-dimethyltransferase RsmA [Bacillota bacterium]